MSDYFFLLAGSSFEDTMRPLLAESWRRRSLAPCRALAGSLLPAAAAFATRYHVGAGEPLLVAVAAGAMPFDRTAWRGLVAEVLIYSALEIPEIQTCPDTLACLLAPGQPRRGSAGHADLPAIEQAHHGSRNLTFGAAVYRPDQAGYNAAADVGRLADYLAGVRPEQWTAASLAALPELPEEDRQEELVYAGDCLAALAELFQHARQSGLVIAHESIY